MIVVVTASRSWANWFVVQRGISDALLVAELNYDEGPGDVVLRHGNARGGDTMAAQVAAMHGMLLDPMPAAWYVEGRFNPKAGFERNTEMLDKDPKPDILIAFWDGASNGTKDTIDKADERGIPSLIYQLSS